MASYSLGEIQDPVERKAIVKQLWNLVDEKGILVLVEPGSPVGFKVECSWGVFSSRKMDLYSFLTQTDDC